MVRKSSITSMFAGSPVKPLQQHMDKVCECADQLPLFFRASVEKDYSSCKRLHKSISGMEAAADAIKIDLRTHLPNSLFMPMPREQILDIVRLQDKIANISQDISGIMTGRKTEIPEAVVELFIAFVQRAVDAAHQAQSAINELDELVETGFRGRQVDVVQNMIAKLEEIEKETDKQERKLRHAMFKIEKGYDPLDMMFLYRMIDWIGKLADVAHQVGGRIQLLMAR
ncbi:MAG: TIGR00153 family protein [Zetaproteobacteria bacterium CG12_big_fil_rev_8_21_14_0_65_54_13]|nr:MAG: TIGR00153 family protein [Zetaproteobacteria bacterium CG23_combo_of_CG06-09_8_20_14_all_54_7]PIW44143.1 MAG: TIGR00153 family protein [Zetaproteobacteria bacterium CG12_big_fil_rev_8_21_14_0_65_54_13]PIX55412.1 MAG: TIGR00153 family protein [Zetaproteobacteria bacterium CG_4_10_14_3_um_filter_54_28]PJA29094.1 MAG: TIGR00153 family protein [Zetaproteobacteria bacterium CG_4_9_14_3_um_filter_54_145]